MSDDLPIDALKAVAHPLRFRILDTLRGGERNVGEIEEATGIGQPTLSQQLAVLRSAGLVETRKDAKLVFYQLAKDEIDALADAIGALSGRPRGMAQTRRPVPGAANFARMT